jgi:hypothetical protein
MKKVMCMFSPLRKFFILNRNPIELRIHSRARLIGLKKEPHCHQPGLHSPALFKTDKSIGLPANPRVSTWLCISEQINSTKNCGVKIDPNEIG